MSACVLCEVNYISTYNLLPSVCIQVQFMKSPNKYGWLSFIFHPALSGTNHLFIVATYHRSNRSQVIMDRMYSTNEDGT